jgi:hypothetical protein
MSKLKAMCIAKGFEKVQITSPTAMPFSQPSSRAEVKATFERHLKADAGASR